MKMLTQLHTVSESTIRRVKMSVHTVAERAKRKVNKNKKMKKLKKPNKRKSK